MELVVFDNFIDDPGIRAAYVGDKTSLMRNLIRFSERHAVTRDAWREYAVTALADCKSIICELSEKCLDIGECLYNAALDDIKQIFEFISGVDVSYTPTGNPVNMYQGYKDSIKTLVLAATPEALLDGLISHYRTLGRGILARYTAFKYDGELQGITSADEQTFDKLIGLDYQKQVLIDNTRAFLASKPSNNVLLFGDRGTGKSSAVKALLNMFYKDGLRIIEMPKQFIKDMPKLTAYLSGRVNKYIIFLDDLSFETHDSEYRSLKIAMEGQLQAHPDNVLIYATSNRRHLIKEKWSDREGSDVHRNDNMQETLSLAERFGISLVFSAPNQKEYLAIVAALLKDKGVEINADIEKKAVIWQMNYGGRSGRCAKQFVSSYVSSL